MKKTALILFGATGDLSREKLFPALFQLWQRGKLEENLHIFAIGRREYSDADFYAHISAGERQYDAEFLALVQYMHMDFLSSDAYSILAAHLEEYDNRAFYLAVPPDSYEVIVQHISSSGAYREHEYGWSRIVIEKPFGTNESSAHELNNLVCSLFNEENTYRIDHYLGKETVENILAFRFSNPLFESVWSADHIDHIQITAAEKHGLQGRTAFYSKVGATKDIIQNHLMQLVTLLTMDEPAELSFDGLAEAKMAILRSLHADSAQSVFGQYDADQVQDELGNAETYVMTTFEIDSPRWSGVPIYVRTGKCLAERVTEVSVYFKQDQHALFNLKEDVGGGNVVTFRIQPNEGIFVRFAVKTPNKHREIRSAQMVYCYGGPGSERLVDAYENLFEAVFQGHHSIALRSDIIEESWRIVDELLKDRDSIPLETYASGSWGPEAADAVLRAGGRRWQVEDQNVCNGVTII